MPIDRKTKTMRRVQIGFMMLLAVVLYVQLTSEDPKPIINAGAPVVFAAAPETSDPFETAVRNNPLRALEMARDRLARLQPTYTCTFVKQESIDGQISAEQETDVKFRSEPFSVMMHFRRNAGLAGRVIYVEDRWVDEDAEDPALRALAVCQPAGGLSYLVKSVKQPIRGKLAQKTSRRSIDQFGFENSLDLLIKYSKKAEAEGVLGMEFVGVTRFDGRDVWLIRRTLPYTGPNGAYPDRVADLYIDQEHKVLLAVYTYSGDEREPEQLLGKYEYRNIRFNADLTDKDFDPAEYGM